MAVQEFRIQVVVDSSGARRGTKDTNRELDKVEKKAKSVGVSLKSAFLFLGGGLALTKGISVIAGFEQGLVGVGKTANLTGSELESLGKSILQLGADLPVATDELLAIGQAAGQLGISGSANILAFTDTVAKLGTASDLSGDRAATTLARLLNVTGEAVSGVGTLGSVIVRLGNEFAATESEIADVATRVAQGAAAFDVSSAQAVAIGAALKSVGVQAEAGGTAIGRSFRTIDAAVRGGGEELDKFAAIAGVSAEAFSSAFQESNVGGFQLFVEGLGRIGDEGGDIAGTLEAIGLSGERSAAVFGTLAARSEVLSTALGTAADELRDTTALEEEAAKGADTLAGDWQRLKNVIVALTVQTGETGLAGAFRFVIQTGSDVIRVLAGLNGKFQGSEVLANLLADAVVGVSTAFAVTLAARAIPAVITALGGLKVALLTNPLTLLPGLIALAVGALVVFREEIANVQVGGARLGDIISASFDAIIERAVFIFPLVKEVAVKSFEAISGFVAVVFDGMAVKINSFFDFFSDGMEDTAGVKSPAARAFRSFGNFVFGLVASIIDVLGGLASTLGEQFSAIGAFDFSSPIESSKRLAEALVTNVADGFDKIIDDTKTNFTTDWISQLEVIAGFVAPTLLNGFDGLEGGAAVAAFLDIAGDVNEKIAAREAERVAKAYSDSFNATVKLLPAVFGFGGGGDGGAGSQQGAAVAPVAPTAAQVPTLNFDEETASLNGLVGALNEEIRLLKLSGEQRAVAIELQGLSLDGDLFSTVAKIGLVDAQLKQIQALEDQATVLDQIKGPQEEEARTVAALAGLFEKGAIEAGEFSSSLVDLVEASSGAFGDESQTAAIESLVDSFDAGTISAQELASAIRDIRDAAAEPADSGNIGEGFVAGFERAKANLNDLAGVAEQTVVNAFGAAENALVDFAKTGELNVGKLVDGIISDLLRLAARQALLALVGGGGEGGFFAGLFGGGKAEGGPVTPGKTFLVGEEGPELFTPKGSGNIVPAGETAAIMSGAQGAPVVNVAPAQVSVQNVIVSDPNEVPEAMDSPAGDRVFTNYLSRNKSTAKGILS